MFYLAKGDKKLGRLLVECSGGESRPLAKTSIIELIVAKRNVIWAEHLKDVPEHVRFWHGHKITRRRICEMPETCDIVLPDVDHIKGPHAKVKLVNPAVVTLMMQFNEEILEYLFKVVNHQRETGEKRMHPKYMVAEEDRINTDHSGISYVYSGMHAGKYRVVLCIQSSAIQRL